jgi:demethylspheroidene O-methyltransferase
MNAPLPHNGAGRRAARAVAVEELAPVVRPPASLRTSWLRLRNAVYANPGFQRWAARFPLTRRIASKRAARVFDLCAGFVYSQVLQAAVQTGLLAALQRGPAPVAQLSAQIGLPLAAAERLLAAAAALQLAEALPDGRYALGIVGADLLGNLSVLLLIEHHALLYRDLSDPVALLRGQRSATELSRFWSYARDPAAADSVAAYSQLMSGSLDLVARDVLDAYPFERHQRVLDVAGGEGGFVHALADRAPRLALSLFDLPAVAARARERLLSVGLATRVDVVSGDMLRDELPGGADLVTLLRVIHDHDDADALRLLKAVARALLPGGRLLLAEPMAGTSGAEAMGAAYFGFYLLAMGRGRPRTEQALRSLLGTAGFARVRELPTRRPILVRLLVAER